LTAVRNTALAVRDDERSDREKWWNDEWHPAENANRVRPSTNTNQPEHKHAVDENSC